LVTKARDPWNAHYQTVFEVAKAFHRRITDADPGITCVTVGNNPPVLSKSDPDKDTFPFAEDATNIHQFAPMIPFGQPPTSTGYGTASTPWALLERAPDSCTSEFGSSCKSLALDYVFDHDKWTIWARSGEQYELSTQLPTLPNTSVDTRMAIYDMSNSIVSKCGTAGTSLCENDDCASTCVGAAFCSCLTFKPTDTEAYRVAVFPFHASDWNSATGANATYKLEVKQTGDDHGDDAAAATPLPADNSLRTAYLNSASPRDYDWYYILATGSETISFSACSVGGGFDPIVAVYNQNLVYQTSILGQSCGTTANLSVTKGVYYFKVYDANNSTGAYQIQVSSSADVGAATTTAWYLYDSAVTYPSRVRAVPQTLNATGDVDIYSFWAAKGDPFSIDIAPASASTAARLQTRLITPNNTLATNYYYTCNSGTTNYEMLRPPYLFVEEFGGVVRHDSEVQRGNHVSFVAPADGFYHFEVSNRGQGSGSYVLYFNYGETSLIDNYPGVP